MVRATGQADQHPVVLEDDVDHRERQLRVAGSGAVRDSQRELGYPVQVAQPATGVPAQDQPGHPPLLGAQPRVGRSLAGLQEGQQVGEGALRLGGEAEPGRGGGVSSVHLLSPDPLTTLDSEVKCWHVSKLIS